MCLTKTQADTAATDILTGQPVGAGVLVHLAISENTSLRCAIFCVWQVHAS